MMSGPRGQGHPMTTDVHSLAAACSLHSLPAQEQAFFDRHLAGCLPCRDDIDGFVATAAALGSATSEQPPPRLRNQVLTRISDISQLPAEDTPPPGRPARLPRVQTLLAAVAGVLALALVVLSGITIQMNERMSELESALPSAGVDDRALAVLAAPDAQTRLLQAGVDSSARFVYSTELDRGLFIGHGMEQLAADRTYELWLFHDGTPLPATVFETDAQGRAFAIVDGSVTGAEFAAVTVEPHGGSAEPTGEILIHGSV